MNKELFNKLTYIKSVIIAKFYGYNLVKFDEERKKIEEQNEYVLSLKNSINEISEEISKKENNNNYLKIHFVLIYILIEIFLIGSFLYISIKNVYILILILSLISTFIWILSSYLRKIFIQDIDILKLEKIEKEKELLYTINVLTLNNLIS